MHTQSTDPRAVFIEEIHVDAGETTLALARELLLEYGRFVVAEPGVSRFCFGGLEKEAERLPRSYHEQNGGCLMAWVKGCPAGFIAWRSIAASPHVVQNAWEMKRLWVRPIARGLGLGEMLTLAVLERAATTGRKAVYLDTVPEAMIAAHRMYLRLGFEPCAPYNDNPVEGLAYLVKFL
jgi:putative acetyltransferase